MAATRAVVRGRIQELMGDVDPSNRVVGQFRYDEVIGRNMHLLAARCIMPKDAVTSITLVNGTFDYAAHASLQYQNIAQAILDSDGTELRYVPVDEFNAYYRQDSSEPHGSGTPREYTLYENTSSLTRVRFGPTPDAAGTVDFYARSLPALLSSDASTIPFSNELMRGLESACAAEIVAALSPEKLSQLGLDKAVASAWMAQANQAVRSYNVRQQQLGMRQNRILRNGARARRRFWSVY